MNYREMISRDLSGTLESGYHEMPVDRLGAFAHANRLGTLLWRLKFTHDAKSYKPAVLLLAKRMSLQSDIGIRLCHMAITEWMLPQCQACLGSRELIVGPRRIICEDCDGYGVKRYSNRQRDAFLGSRYKPWARKYNKVWRWLTTDERDISRVMAEQLERNMAQPLALAK